MTLLCSVLSFLGKDYILNYFNHDGLDRLEVIGRKIHYPKRNFPRLPYVRVTALFFDFGLEVQTIGPTEFSKYLQVYSLSYKDYL